MGDWLSIKPLDQFTGWVKKEFVEPKRGAAVPVQLYPEPPVLQADAPSVSPAAEKTPPPVVVPECRSS